MANLKRERDRKADANRRENNPWRRLYKTARWAKTRLRILARDLYTCRRCGVLMTKPSAAIVDHITPHRGDSALFFDEENLQALCKTCHDSGKQSEERRGYSSVVGEDGYPVDPRHPANR